MVLFSIRELVDIVVMSLIVAYLFKDVFRRPDTLPKQRILSMKQSSDGSYGLGHDPQFLDLKSYISTTKRSWYDGLKFSLMVTAPAIILHEFGHKFIALSFGLQATFHAAYSGLMMGLFFKWFLGFIMFIPAYVSIPAATAPLVSALISIAGPLVNLVLWLGARHCLKRGLLKGHEHALVLVREINRLMFIFNILPFPGFDGFHAIVGLLRAIGLI